ncbi:MAG: hypothetical protein ACFCUU_17210, partial [Cyclobacteriaceae bacterium]
IGLQRLGASAIWLIAFTLLVYQPAGSQPLEKVLDLEFKPNLFEIDPTGNLWLSDNNGNVHRFNNKQSLKDVFQPERPMAISRLDCSQNLRTLLFYKESQSCLLLNRFLTESPLYQLPPDAAPITQACLSSDNHLWGFNPSNFTLYKININSQTIVFSLPLAGILPAESIHFRHMAEYRNRLYVVSPEMGLWVFDRLGNVIKSFEHINTDWVGFQGNSLYYYHDNKISLVNLLTWQETKIDLPDKANPDLVRLHGNKMYILLSNQLQIRDL